LSLQFSPISVQRQPGRREDDGMTASECIDELTEHLHDWRGAMLNKKGTPADADLL
jgi:hypothetical protein